MVNAVGRKPLGSVILNFRFSVGRSDFLYLVPDHIRVHDQCLLHWVPTDLHFRQINSNLTLDRVRVTMIPKFNELAVDMLQNPMVEIAQAPVVMHSTVS